MKEKPMIFTNPYLKDRHQREQLFITSTTSNAAVEGVHVDIPAAGNTQIKRSTKKQP